MGLGRFQIRQQPVYNFALALTSHQDLAGPKLGPIQEQSWLREEDGEGPLARSDVAIADPIYSIETRTVLIPLLNESPARRLRHLLRLFIQG